MPYRSARVDAPKLTPDAGIVDDMVRQFADRHAFLRELVQNGIDAGATRIDVRLERSPDGAVRTSVEDDGAGMTRAIIEGPLLTLFESSKESDSTKIGKYGIGFVSIFAIEPERVDVRTRRANEAWIVRLFGDHSFELAEDAPRPGTGTEVTLLHTMTAESFATHVAQAKTALSRWCRHAHVPITFVALDGYEGAEATEINEPLTLSGVVTVAVSEGQERFVVAIGAGESQGRPPHLDEAINFGGFYNRGLTLMESANHGEDGLEGVRFKIESPRLSHTLSRDSVRRDDESRRVLARVRSIVTNELWNELSARLADAAEEASTGSGTRFAALFDVALLRQLAGKTSDVSLPLVEPIAGRRTMPMRAFSTQSGAVLCVADESSSLTRAMASTGRPVVRHSALALTLRRFTKKSVLLAREAFAFAAAIEERDEDRALVATLVPMLRAAGKRIARARLAQFEGIASDGSCRIVRTSEGFAITAPDDAMLRAWGGSATIFLNAEHATVRLARRRAKSDAGVAAHLLARAILVAEGPLAAAAVDRMLHDAVPGQGDG